MKRQQSGSFCLAQKTIDWLTPEAFPKVGFQRLTLPIDESKIQGCYQKLTELSHLIKNEYDESWEKLDQKILNFLKQKIGLEVDFEANFDPVTFNNMHHDAIKYQQMSQNGINHEMRSFHYVEGLYEELVQSAPKIALDFLKPLSEIVAEARAHLESLIDCISAKLPPFLSLKLWQHCFGAVDQQLLPLHVDRSLFTIIMHTEGAPCDALKIFPNKEEPLFNIVAHHKPFPLLPSDYPLLIPGRQAKEFFGITPTPHYVAASQQENSLRNSLILFIGVLR